jgi:predicted pyridoxine 5'-phosphate oxidase superfamily flavin-nucleotide-binding protein
MITFSWRRVGPGPVIQHHARPCFQAHGFVKRAGVAQRRAPASLATGGACGKSSIHMVKINQEMKRVVAEQRLGFMATVCNDGTPNLSPKGLTFVLDDEHLVIGEVRSPGTICNLATRPTAEINVVDPIGRRGFRFKGDCRVYSEGAEFEELVALLRAKGAKSRIRSVIVMTVERALPLVSPLYDDSGTTEKEVRRRHMERLHDLNKDLSSDA